MYVYRISHVKYAHSLSASGSPARWNSKGTFVIYSAQSRALACLENVVHRTSEGLNELFRTMVIEIPDKLPIVDVDISKLPTDWKEITQYPACQAYGDAWVRSGASAVLRAPSVIIPNEFNYIISIYHPDFAQIKLVSVEDFIFDPRIKQDDV